MNRNALDSADATTTRPRNDDREAGDDAFAMSKILDVLLELRDGQSKIRASISNLEADVHDIKETRDLEAQAMQEWRPQVSNDVKAMDEKLSVFEKR